MSRVCVKWFGLVPPPPFAQTISRPQFKLVLVKFSSNPPFLRYKESTTLGEKKKEEENENYAAIYNQQMNYGTTSHSCICLKTQTNIHWNNIS